MIKWKAIISNCRNSAKNQ